MTYEHVKITRWFRLLTPMKIAGERLPAGSLALTENISDKDYNHYMAFKRIEPVPDSEAPDQGYKTPPKRLMKTWNTASES